MTADELGAIRLRAQQAADLYLEWGQEETAATVDELCADARELAQAAEILIDAAERASTLLMRTSGWDRTLPIGRTPTRAAIADPAGHAAGLMVDAFDDFLRLEAWSVLVWTVRLRRAELQARPRLVKG